jgi:hypothetical protein
MVALTHLPEGSLFYAKPHDQAAIAASLRGLLSS